MKLYVIPDRRRLVAEQGSTQNALVRVSAPPLHSGARGRAAVACVAMVDVSSSMAGENIAAVKTALRVLVHQLLPGDWLGLGSFDRSARMVIPLVELTEASRRNFIGAVDALYTGVGTNLEAGVVLAMKHAREPLPPHLSLRLVVLTDGYSSVGVRDVDSLAQLTKGWPGNFTLSAFGYGEDAHHSLLAEVAVAGRGNYAHIAAAQDLSAVYEKELGSAVGAYARDVVLTVVPFAGARQVTRLPDLVWQQEHDALVTVAVPAWRRMRDVEIAKVELIWKDDAGVERQTEDTLRVDFVDAGDEDKSDDKRVLRRLEERLLGRYQKDAERHTEIGEFAKAVSLLQDALAQVTDAELRVIVEKTLLPAYGSSEAHQGSSALRNTTLVTNLGGRFL